VSRRGAVEAAIEVAKNGVTWLTERSPDTTTKVMVLLAHRVVVRKDFDEQFGVKLGLNFVQIK
jgi:hypothetical protein